MQKSLRIGIVAAIVFVAGIFTTPAMATPVNPVVTHRFGNCEAFVEGISYNNGNLIGRGGVRSIGTREKCNEDAVFTVYIKKRNAIDETPGEHNGISGQFNKENGQDAIVTVQIPCAGHGQYYVDLDAFTRFSLPRNADQPGKADKTAQWLC